MCSVLQCVALCCSGLQCVAAYCSVLQHIAVCSRSVKQCKAAANKQPCLTPMKAKFGVLQCAAVCCSALQCVAVCGSGKQTAIFHTKCSTYTSLHFSLTHSLSLSPFFYPLPLPFPLPLHSRLTLPRLLPLLACDVKLGVKSIGDEELVELAATYIQCKYRCRYCSVLQCIAVCCSVLQCVAVYCSVMQYDAEGWSVFHCVNLQ